MERGGYQDLTGMFPRPGKALKAVLGLILGLSLVNFVLYNWVPSGRFLFNSLVCSTGEVVGHLGLWRLLTAGALTLPGGPGALSHLMFTLVGLYFLSPDLEARWGPWRYVRFIALATVVGFALGIAIDLLAPPQLEVFHPPLMLGADAVITATTVAWARQNADRHVRLFFVLPVRGAWLLWFAIGYCVLSLVAWDASAPSGVVAPFGGLVVGLLLAGSPSPLRALYLRAKLRLLRRKSGRGQGQDQETRGRGGAPRPARSTREGGPPLRIVYGGLEDDLTKRKPPNDKRFLN